MQLVSTLLGSHLSGFHGFFDKSIKIPFPSLHHLFAALLLTTTKRLLTELVIYSGLQLASILWVDMTVYLLHLFIISKLDDLS